MTAIPITTTTIIICALIILAVVATTAFVCLRVLPKNFKQNQQNQSAQQTLPTQQTLPQIYATQQAQKPLLQHQTEKHVHIADPCVSSMSADSSVIIQEDEEETPIDNNPLLDLIIENDEISIA